MKQERKTIKPLHNNVVIRPDSVADLGVSDGGIITHTSINKPEPRTGIVIAVGPGSPGIDGNLVPSQAQVGDRVLFERFSPMAVEVSKGDEVLIIPDSHIIATYSVEEVEVDAEIG